MISNLYSHCLGLDAKRKNMLQSSALPLSGMSPFTQRNLLIAISRLRVQVNWGVALWEEVGDIS